MLLGALWQVDLRVSRVGIYCGRSNPMWVLQRIPDLGQSTRGEAGPLAPGRSIWIRWFGLTAREAHRHGHRGGAQCGVALARQAARETRWGTRSTLWQTSQTRYQGWRGFEAAERGREPKTGSDATLVRRRSFKLRIRGTGDRG